MIQIDKSWLNNPNAKLQAARWTVKIPVQRFVADARNYEGEDYMGEGIEIDAIFREHLRLFFKSMVPRMRKEMPVLECRVLVNTKEPCGQREHSEHPDDAYYSRLYDFLTKASDRHPPGLCAMVMVCGPDVEDRIAFEQIRRRFKYKWYGSIKWVREATNEDVSFALAAERYKAQE